MGEEGGGGGCSCCQCYGFLILVFVPSVMIYTLRNSVCTFCNDLYIKK